MGHVDTKGFPCRAGTRVGPEEKYARDGILFLRARIIGGVGGRWEYKFTAVSCSFTFPAFFIVICIHSLSLLALLACYKLYCVCLSNHPAHRFRVARETNYTPRAWHQKRQNFAQKIKRGKQISSARVKTSPVRIRYPPASNHIKSKTSKNVLIHLLILHLQP